MCVLFALSVGPFPVSFSLLGPFYSLRQSNIEIRPTSTPTMASKFFFFFASKFLSGRKSCSSLPLVVYELFWILLSQTSFELGQLLFIWGQSALRQKHKGNPLQISGTLSINSYLFLFLFFLLKCIASSKSHLHLLNFIRLQDSGCVSSACAIIWKIASGKYAGHFIGSTLFSTPRSHILTVHYSVNEQYGLHTLSSFLVV